MTEVPVIVRISGLPVAAATALRGERAMAAAARVDALEQQRATTRAAVADRVFAILSHSEPALRGPLLQLKRDCFNGRSLAKHRAAGHWAALGDLGARAAAVEDELAAARVAFAADYAADRDRARDHLRALTGHAELMRGVALASPGLAAHLGRLHAREPAHYRRTEHKVAHSLLRYVTRAATKLSPYSTLTKIGVGVIGGGDTALRVHGDARRDRSLVRVKRYLLDQCCRLLFHHPAVRAQLGLGVNTTVEDLGDALYRFLRPMVFERDPDSGDLRNARPSIVQVRLRGPLIAWLRDALARPGWTYAAARAVAHERFGAPVAELDATLDRLLDIGFLRLIPPWASHAAHLEPELLRFLRGLEDTAGLHDVVDALERLVAVERAFARTADPLRAVAELDRTVSRLFDGIRAATQPTSELRFEKAAQNYYEDVLASAPTRAPTREIARLDRATADELSRTGDLIWRLANLYEPRHELHHALYHHLCARWPERTRVPFLELFASVQPLWERYLGHLAVPGNRAALFDPFALPELAALQRLRGEVRSAFDALGVADEDGVRVPVPALAALVARIPARYRPPVPACLFVQPLQASGETWVVNRVFESTGRFSSRYTAVMEPEVRAAYVRHLEACGRPELDGERVELLDMLFTRSNTVNLHAPQTPKVLEAPGEHADVPDDRRVQLGDLVVDVDRERRQLVLRDVRGPRYVPCFLGPMQHEILPSFLKLLDVFGAMPRAGLQLGRTPAHRGDVAVYPRLWLGRLLLLRRRWIVPRRCVPRWSDDRADAFLAAQRWRREHDIPDQCFLIEGVTADYTARKVYKPQYIDFRAPELVALFAASLAAGDDAVTLEEAAPTPDAFPVDDHGEARGIEIILEGLALCI